MLLLIICLGGGGVINGYCLNFMYMKKLGNNLNQTLKLFTYSEF